MSEETENGTQVQEQEVEVEQEQQQEQAVVGTKAAKAKGTGDLLADIAQRVEPLTRIKALNRAATLAENIETSYLELGGVLRVIRDQSWWEGHKDFGAFVQEKFGFAERKAKYLIEIYTELVTKHIPWDKVQHLGWTKLKDLARVLTLENVDEWALKAEKLTVVELQALLKGGTPEGDGAPSTKTNDDAHKLKFTLKGDQVETVTAALNKAKAESNTEYDSTALELICTGYLSGSSNIGVSDAPAKTLAELMAEGGWQAVLIEFEKQWPAINVTVDASALETSG